MTQVITSNAGRMLFVGTSSGAIRCMKYPLVEPEEWQEHLVHSGSVMKVKFSYAYTVYMYMSVPNKCWLPVTEVNGWMIAHTCIGVGNCGSGHSGNRMSFQL